MLPQCSHVAQKRGVFYFRRRIPGQAQGEITVSLSTKDWREAEHLSAALGIVFDQTWNDQMDGGGDSGGTEALKRALRAALRKRLNDDLKLRRERSLPGRPPWAPIYAHWQENDPDPSEDLLTAELAAIRDKRSGEEHALKTGRYGWDDIPGTEETRHALLDRLGIPRHLNDRYNEGLAQTAIEAWKVIEGRTLGTEPLVFLPDEEVETASSAAPQSLTAPLTTPIAHATAPIEQTKPAPNASALIEPFFKRRTADGATHQVMSQERTTLRHFVEVCGDRPLSIYGRKDVTDFLAALKRLPKTYGKSPKDRDKTLTEIIAAADAAGVKQRLSDKTVKRHLSALSQFFHLAVDEGLMTVTARNEMVLARKFKAAAGARGQRDKWTSAELKTLFTSPIWTGCKGPSRRSTPGIEVIKDDKFWVPLLAVYHGARLEEFADLYRRDIGCDAGTWFFNIVETIEDPEAGKTRRRLKTKNATRVIPMHPELIRLGFLDYVAKVAPKPDDPLFPLLEPQGADGKRGPRLTRWFVTYRRAIKVYREGIAMHAFRHTARTRIADAITDERMKRHANFMFGHTAGGGEGDERYDKGPALREMAATLALLEYPEIDLTRLHRGSGDASGDRQEA